MKQACNIGTSKELNAIIVRMFKLDGLLFNLTRNSYYSVVFIYAAKQSNFQSQAYRGSLQQSGKAHIKRMLEPINGMWKAKMSPFTEMDGQMHKRA